MVRLDVPVLIEIELHVWYLVVNTSIHVIGGPACIYLIGVYRHEKIV